MDNEALRIAPVAEDAAAGEDFWPGFWGPSVSTSRTNNANERMQGESL